MIRYRYKVCKGRTIVALTTTLREAESEAKRVGGTFQSLKTANPLSFRPVGIDAKSRDRSQFKKYLFTILSPKCKFPLAVYLDPLSYDDPKQAMEGSGDGEGSYTYYAGFNPDRTRIYAIGYVDESEYSRAGYMRQHMMPGLLNNVDRGNGIGPAMYYAGVLTIACINKEFPGSFSPKKVPAGSRYAGRSTAADSTWQKMVEKKIATEAKEGKTSVVQQLARQTVLDTGIVLHATDRAWQDILYNHPPRAGVPYVPPAEGWADIDVGEVNDRHLKDMLKFCAANSGLDANDYLATALDNLAKNDSLVYDPEDLAAALKVKFRNPRQNNPAASAAARKWAKGLSDADKWGW